MRISTGRSIAFVLGIALVVGSSGFLLQAEPPQEVGTWASIGTTDPQATRTGAAVATLPDRTTLVAGGLTAEGAATDSIVLHDPLTNASTTVGQLLVPRVDAAATRLDDGRFLITGGQVGSLISSDIEIFDLATGESTFAALLQRPRTGHASALLADGTVLIVGGTTDDGAVLATTERFDPSSNSVSAAEPMAVARTGASATTLIDGRVLVAGGHDGSQDLKSAEIYSPVDGEFLSVPTLMSEARSGHSAVLLPHNNSVLIAGGTAADSSVTTTDLFLPTMFPDPYSWGMGTFGPTDPQELARMTMVQPRSRAVAGPWGDDGYAFAMGGGSGDGEVYRFATIKTDKDDYAPGELAVITGSGWQVGEAVKLVFQEDPAVHEDYVIDRDGEGNPVIVADENGDIYYDQWAPEEHDLDVRFYLMATGEESQRRAQTTFTDGAVRVKTFGTSGVAANVDWAKYSTANCTGVSTSSGTISALTTGSGTDIPSGTPSSGGSLSLTAQSVSGYTFADWSGGIGPLSSPNTGNPICLPYQNGTRNIDLTYTTAAANVAPVASAVSISGTAQYGQLLTGTFTYSDANGDAEGTSTFRWLRNGTTVVGTNQTYTTVSADVLQTLTFEVTPVAATGTSPGSAVQSSAVPVGKAPLTVTASSHTVTYGDAVPTVTPGYATFVSPDNAAGIDTPPTCTTTYTTTSAALSAQTTSCSGGSDNNYSFSFVAGTVTVDKRNITVTADAGQAKVYGADDPATFTYTVTTGALQGTDTFTGALSRVAGEDVGLYAIGQNTLAISDGNGGLNYELTYVGADFSITARAITVTADAGQTKVYGADDPATFTYTVTTGALQGTDTFTGALSRVAGEDVGLYAIEQNTLAISDGNGGLNYELTYVGADFSITARPITVTADAGQTKVYGADDPATFTYTVTTGALQGTDTFTGALSRVAGEDVGLYAIEQNTLAISDGNGGLNYELTYVGADFSITARPITVTADAGQTKVYGADDPATFTYTVTTGALQGTDTFTGALSRVAGENVGLYAIGQNTLAISDGNGGLNYALTYVGADFSITARPITVTADAGQTKVYGADDPAAFTYTVTTGVLQGTDTFTGALSRVAGENVGLYAIGQNTLVISDGNGGLNYALTYVGADFSITARPITVTADAGQTKVYGADDPAAFTYTVTTGALQGTDTFTGALSRVAGENVGLYAIGQNTLAISDGNGGLNYALTYVGADFSITKATAVVVVAPYNVNWDGNAHTAAVVSITGVNGETGSTVGTVNVSNTTHTAIGTYASDYWFFTGTGNYNNIGNTTITDVISTAYCFNGFLAPIGGAVENVPSNGGSYADPVRAFKLGSTIPVKFILNAKSGSTCGAVVTTGTHKLEAIRYSSSTDSDPAIDASPTDAATTGNQFRLTGTEWHFNLSTKGAAFSQGTWLLKATLQDGSVKTVWVTIKK